MEFLKRKIGILVRRVQATKNWLAFIPPFIYFGRWPRVAKLRSGGKIKISAPRSSDMAFFNDIVVDDIYHIKHIARPKKIIDVGANIGVFTILAASLFPNTEIISIEPETENFKKLTENIALSGAKNVTAVNCAIAATAGERPFYVSPVNSGNHSLYGQGAARPVKTRTLKEFLPTDVLKLDAEGIEYEIFKLEVPDINYMVMETHGDNKELFALLEKKYVRHSEGPIHAFIHK